MVTEGTSDMHIGYIVLSFTSCTTNGILIWIILRKNIFRTIGNLIIVSLCTSDFLLASTIVPVEILHTLKPDLPIMGVACLAHQVVMVSLPLVSVCHLLLVAVERFMKIVFPLRYHHIASTKWVLMMISAAWCIPLIISIVPFFQLDQTSDGNITDTRCIGLDLLSCSYLAVVFSIIGVVCIIMIFLYGTILRISFRHIRQIRCITDKFIGKNRSHASLELKAIMVLIVTIGYFVFSWMPFAMAVIQHCITTQYPVYWFPAVFLAYFNTTVNPVIYGIGNKELRISLLEVFCKRKKVGYAQTELVSKVATIVRSTKDLGENTKC